MFFCSLCYWFIVPDCRPFVSGREADKGQRPFFILCFSQLWLSCCQSMITQCAGTIVLHHSCLSVSHTWMPAYLPNPSMHTYMQASVLTRIQTNTREDSTHAHTDSCYSLSASFTDVQRDHVFFSSSPSSRSGFELYYFLLVDFHPWGLSKKKRTKRERPLSILDRILKIQFKTGSFGVTTRISTHSWPFPHCTASTPL